MWSVFQGLRVAPCSGVSVKCQWPTSGAWVLPIDDRARLAQAPHHLGVAPRRAAAAAAEGGRVAGEVDVVLDRDRDAEQRRARRSAPSRRSASSASASASSAQMTRKAFSVSWLASACSSAASTSSRDVTLAGLQQQHLLLQTRRVKSLSSSPFLASLACHLLFVRTNDKRNG